MFSREKLRLDYLTLLSEYGLTSPHLYKPPRTVEQQQILDDITTAVGDKMIARIQPFDDPSFQSINYVYTDKSTLRNSNNRVLRLMSAYMNIAHRPLRQKIYVGEFPTDSINAEARLTNNGYLILIDSGFIYFLRQALEILNLTDLRQSQFWLSGLMAMYAIRKNPVYSPIHPSDSVNGIIIMILFNTICDFVLAHEYGHIIRGHLVHPMPPPHVMHSAAGDLEVISKHWKHEYAADEFAFDLITKEKRFVTDSHIKTFLGMNYDPKTRKDMALYIAVSRVFAAFAAPRIFFALASMISNVCNVMANGGCRAEAETTHPPFYRRLENVKRIDGGQSNRFISCNPFLDLVTRLEDCTEEVFRVARQIALDTSQSPTAS